MVHKYSEATQHKEKSLYLEPRNLGSPALRFTVGQLCPLCEKQVGRRFQCLSLNCFPRAVDICLGDCLKPCSAVRLDAEASELGAAGLAM